MKNHSEKTVYVDYSHKNDSKRNKPNHRQHAWNDKRSYLNNAYRESFKVIYETEKRS